MVLLTVAPVSSCAAERSFSALRRLKTWLCTTMTQKRLNALAVCEAHQELLDDIDLNLLCAEFSKRSDFRRKLFGKFAL